MWRGLTRVLWTRVAGIKVLSNSAVLKSALGKARVAFLTGSSACVSVFVKTSQIRALFCCVYILTRVCVIIL